jgi:hypothetical protein
MVQLLRYFLTITGCFEFYSLYLLYTMKDVHLQITTGFMSGEVSTQGSIFMYALILMSLTVMRLHLVADMSNKALYRTILWIHLMEAGVFVGLPLYNGTLNINVISVVIALTPLWLMASYSGYLYPKDKAQKTK